MDLGKMTHEYLTLERGFRFSVFYLGFYAGGFEH